MEPHEITEELIHIGRVTGGHWFGKAMDLIGRILGRHDQQLIGLNKRVSTLEREMKEVRRGTARA